MAQGGYREVSRLLGRWAGGWPSMHRPGPSTHFVFAMAALPIAPSPAWPPISNPPPRPPRPAPPRRRRPAWPPSQHLGTPRALRTALRGFAADLGLPPGLMPSANQLLEAGRGDIYQASFCSFSLCFFFHSFFLFSAGRVFVALGHLSMGARHFFPDPQRRMGRHTHNGRCVRAAMGLLPPAGNRAATRAHPNHNRVQPSFHATAGGAAGGRFSRGGEPTQAPAATPPGLCLGGRGRCPGRAEGAPGAQGGRARGLAGGASPLGCGAMEFFQPGALPALRARQEAWLPARPSAGQHIRPGQSAHFLPCPLPPHHAACKRPPPARAPACRRASRRRPGLGCPPTRSCGPRGSTSSGGWVASLGLALSGGGRAAGPAHAVVPAAAEPSGLCAGRAGEKDRASRGREICAARAGAGLGCRAPVQRSLAQLSLGAGRVPRLGLRCML